MFTPARLLMISTATLTLTACSQPFDIDLRSLGNGFDTSDAVTNLPPRPQADHRGVISYPNYQVAVARRGDTVADVAARVGIPSVELARHNGMKIDTPLNAGQTVALPSRVAEPANGVTRPDDITVTPLENSAQPTFQTGSEPLRHKVQAGETAFGIARRYGIPAKSLAEWNGLNDKMTIRTGQVLLIPVAGMTAGAALTPATATNPGQGSPTPTPPSSIKPLPSTVPAPVADPTPVPATAAPQPAPKPKTTSASASSAKMTMPVNGSIIRAYSKGKNDGIDIAAAAGSPVKAAQSGTVAAVTENTNGAKIVVIKHSGGVLTVYVNVTDLKVKKGSSVSRGQTIAKVAKGNPASLHFEVRKGLESVDPAGYL